MNCKQRLNSGRRLAEEMCVPDCVSWGTSTASVSDGLSKDTEKKTSMGLEEQKHLTWLEQKSCKEVLAHKSQVVGGTERRSLEYFFCLS